MMVKASNIVEMSDSAIVRQIGEFIRHTRVNQNKTQAQLAKESGLNRWTISQIENGEPVNLMSLIQILRASDSLYVLDQFEFAEQISPIEYAKLKKRQRQRVRNSDDPVNKVADTYDLGW